MRTASFVFSALLALPVAASAQIGELPTTPELSFAASVSQTVGVTSFTVTYSSPAARERTIWGDLVPYGTIWRAGANAPTQLTADTDFTFGGEPVEAGTYTLMVLPEEDTWTFVLNTDSSGRGAYGHDPAEDVASVTVSPAEAPARERLLYLFDNTTSTVSHLTLEWAGLAGAVELGVDTNSIVDANIESTLAGAWRPHFNAARYYLNEGRDMDQAAEWMQRSVDIEATWWNHWFFALIRAEQGDYDAARELAAQAAELGDGDRVWTNFFAPDAESIVDAWP